MKRTRCRKRTKKKKSNRKHLRAPQDSLPRFCFRRAYFFLASPPWFSRKKEQSLFPFELMAFWGILSWRRSATHCLMVARSIYKRIRVHNCCEVLAKESGIVSPSPKRETNDFSCARDYSTVVGSDWWPLVPHNQLNSHFFSNRVTRFAKVNKENTENKITNFRLLITHFFKN